MKAIIKQMNIRNIDIINKNEIIILTHKRDLFINVF